MRNEMKAGGRVGRDREPYAGAHREADIRQLVNRLAMFRELDLSAQRAGRGRDKIRRIEIQMTEFDLVGA